MDLMHPTPAAIRAMVDRMRVAIDTYCPRINMLYPAVEQKCGSVCCHAGLYMLAKWAMNDASLLPQRVHYSYGSSAMAVDLGFMKAHELKRWAKENAALWGNSRGASMFHCASAFNYSKGVLNANDICEHWLAVADRIEALKGAST